MVVTSLWFGALEVCAQEEEVSVHGEGLQELISDCPKFEQCWGRGLGGAGQLSRRPHLCLCPGVLLIVSDRPTSQLLCSLCTGGGLGTGCISVVACGG